MAPDCEEAERLNVDGYHQEHQGRRILPQDQVPALAWVEEELDRPNSVTNSPGENRRLLSPNSLPHKSKLQAGLTLGVTGVPKYPHTSKCVKQKTKFEKRVEKFIVIFKPPYFIVSMIVLIICIHVVVPERARVWFEWSPGAWRREPWRLLTYGFVHATAAHLALNAVVALAVGWVLEREQGWWRVVCVWAGGVAAGALGAGALQPSVRVVGASAAVYALLTAHLPNVCLRFGYIPLWWFRPLSVVVLGASEGCWALVRAAPRAGAGAGAGAGGPGAGAGDQVAWSAHALGAAVGVPLAFLVFKGENDSKMSVKVCRVLSLATLVGGAVLATLHFNLWYDPDD